MSLTQLLIMRSIRRGGFCNELLKLGHILTMLNNTEDITIFCSINLKAFFLKNQDDTTFLFNYPETVEKCDIKFFCRKNYDFSESGNFVPFLLKVSLDIFMK